MSYVLKILIVFFTSMVPVLELRAAIPIGFSYGFPLWLTLVLSITGNMIIIPFVVLLFNFFLSLMKKIKLTAGFAEWLEKRAKRNSRKVENMIFLGLMLFVAIPLPGTGAWTASMVAGILDMKARKAFLPIALGVLIAALIVTLITYGVFSVVGKI